MEQYKSGFEYMGKHTFNEFGLTVLERDIGAPNKKKIKQSIPFSNVEYDFSEIYGIQTYEPRILRYVLNVVGDHIDSKVRINLIRTRIENWLLTSNQQSPLYDDSYPNYYFMAEIENGPVFNEQDLIGLIEVEFKAYPFKIDSLPEGHDIWDDFNFDLDVAQFTDFEVRGSENVLLINNGISDVTPKIITNAPFTILHDGKEFKVNAGTSQDHDFVLNPGENRMILQGNGHIEFLFHKELI